MLMSASPNPAATASANDVARCLHLPHREAETSRQARDQVVVLRDEIEAERDGRSPGILERGSLVGHERGSDDTRGKDLVGRLAVHPGSLGQYECLAHRHVGGMDNGIDGELDGCARPQGTDVEHAIGYRGQHRPGPLHGVCRSTRHHQQLPLLDDRHTARDRSVHERGAGRIDGLAEARDCLRSDGAHLEHDRAGRERGCCSTRAEKRGLDGGIVRQAADHELGVTDGIGDGPGHVGPGLAGDGVGASGGSVVDGEVDPGAGQSAGDGGAHVAQAEHGHAGAAHRCSFRPVAADSTVQPGLTLSTGPGYGAARSAGPEGTEVTAT